MQFASKTPRDLNHDPEPWLFRGMIRHAARKGNLKPQEYAFDPRPEFDHVQHNEPNPYIVEFRRYISEREYAWESVPSALIEDAIDALRVHAGELIWKQGEDEGLDELVLFLIDAYDNTPWGVHNAHINHARRVLTRLARLS